MALSSSSLIVCPECHRCRVERARKDPICYRVGDGPAQTSGRNQDSAILRTFAEHPGEKLPFDALYQALGGSPEAYRTIHSLRTKRRIQVICEMAPKSRGSGDYGVFYLGEGVKVWEPGEDGGDDA